MLILRFIYLVDHWFVVTSEGTKCQHHDIEVGMSSSSTRRRSTLQSSAKASENSDSIHVVCRFRPGRTKDAKEAIRIDHDVNSVVISDSTDKSFTFDKARQIKC